MAYERKALDQSLPFDQLKARSLINESAKAADHDPHFSQRIRERCRDSVPAQFRIQTEVATESQRSQSKEPAAFLSVTSVALWQLIAYLHHYAGFRPVLAESEGWRRTSP